eukprot:gene29187-31094_t
MLQCKTVRVPTGGRSVNPMRGVATPKAFTTPRAFAGPRHTASCAFGSDALALVSIARPTGIDSKRRVTVCRSVGQGATATVGLPALLALDGSYEEAVTFTPVGNWILPGRVMLDSYEEAVTFTPVGNWILPGRVMLDSYEEAVTFTPVGNWILPGRVMLDSYEEAVTFTPVGNWILPGRVMLGRYPYVEPSRCPSRNEGDETLSTILKEGHITTFVSLQAETPAQTPLQMLLKLAARMAPPYREIADLIKAATAEK